MDGSQGLITYTVTSKAKFNVTDGSPPPPSISQSCTGNIVFQFNVILNTRAVSLHRQGARGETVDAAGNIHGDTIFSYYQYVDGVDPAFRKQFVQNVQMFYPSLFGGWHINYQDGTGVMFTWSPSHTDDTWNAASRLCSTGTMEWYNGSGTWAGTSDTPNLFIQTYMATDTTNSATATAQYYLTKHSPLEPLQTNPDQMRIEDITRPPGAQWGRSQNGEDIAVYLEKSYSWTASVSVSTELPVSIWEGQNFGIDVGFSITYTENLGVSVTAHNVPAGYGTYLEVFTVYKYHTGTVNKWDAGGFVGVAPYSIKEPNGDGIQTHFPYVSLPSGPPPGP